MFGKKLRIRFVKGVGFSDGTARDPGEVAEYPATEAMEHVSTGRAELAPAAPLGRVVSTIPERACWSCGGTGQTFAMGRCDYCRAPA